MLGALQRQCCSRVGAAAAVGVGLGVSAGLAGFRSAAGPAQCDAAEQQSPSLGRTEVHELAQGLQQQFVLRLEALATADGIDSAGDFHPVSWLRDEGRHGGGTRYELQNTPLFNRASVNVSSVHYADMPKYPVKSATALSMILHPSNPHAPSMHLHVSYMEPNGRPPYWRMIADLNPSIEDPAATERFEAAMRAAMPATLYADSKLFGDRYFYIPDLDRHRGAAHVFVGALGAGDIAGMSTGQCAALAERFASSALETYCAIVQEALDTHEESAITAEDRATQLAYHTLYFFQVLTLDRGTTHGVLAHNQNDVGTLGSLPSRIDPELLAAWGRCVCAFSLVTCAHEGRACAT
jgi:coproporphyrinogen III oxidase